jgi:adenine deaminase
MIPRSPLLALACLFASGALAQSYDLVLGGGRVMDPETGLDAVRNVGITGDRIVRITEQPLSGKRTINAAGLVVATGSSTFTSTPRIPTAAGSKPSTA